MHPRLLERAGPFDVAPLVEPRLELDEAHRLLAFLGPLDERADQDAVVARAVDGRLHDDDVRVQSGRLREGLEARAIRVVRLMDEDVSSPCFVEEARGERLSPGETRRHHRDVRLFLQIRPVERGELHQLGEVERALDPVHLGRVGAEPESQSVDHLLRGRRAHLDADDVAEAALAQLGLDGFEKVCRVVGHFEVGVPCHAEHGALDDRDARKELRQEMRDDLLERDEETVIAELQEAWESLGDLDSCEPLLTRLRVCDEHRERERQPGDVRKRLARADGERGQHGVDVALEALLELFQVLLLAVLDATDHDAFGCERGAEVPLPDSRLTRGELENALTDLDERLHWRHPVGREHHQPGLRLPEQAGDAHLEELVQVRREDRAELHAFEERDRLVRRELEHAGVEVEQRQLAVEKPLARGVQAGCHLRIRHRLLVIAAEARSALTR